MKKGNTQQSGNRTLLWSVIMSSPGPLVVGLGLLAGRSSTQVADFVRRSAELLAILMAFVTYRITTGREKAEQAVDLDRKARIECMSNRFVGAMMCLGGSIMLGLAFLSGQEDKGNVIPGLVIALLGVLANTIFWRKYTRLHKAEPNPILAVQARLYGAKSLVDGCVTIALLSVVIAPGTEASHYLDLIGSVVVALYLIWCGIRTIMQTRQNQMRQKQTEKEETT